MPVYIAEPREPDGRRQLAVAAVFVVLALTLNVLPPGGQRWISGAVRVTVLAPFLWTQGQLQQARVQATEATNLQARVDSLATALLSLGSLSEENRRLRALLGLQAGGQRAVVAASAIRSASPGSEGTFILDKGRRSGIEAGDPILAWDGLVGLVIETHEQSAVGMDWTNPLFRASAMTEDGTIYGIVEPVPGTFREDDRLRFNGAPYSSNIEPSTEIQASGLGGVYPRGVRIGTVDSVAEEDAGWRKSYWIQPAVIPASVTHVLVVVRDGSTSGPQGDLRIDIDSTLFELDVPTLDTTGGTESGPPTGDR